MAPPAAERTPSGRSEATDRRVSGRAGERAHAIRTPLSLQGRQRQSQLPWAVCFPWRSDGLRCAGTRGAAWARALSPPESGLDAGQFRERRTRLCQPALRKPVVPRAQRQVTPADHRRSILVMVSPGKRAPRTSAPLPCPAGRRVARSSSGACARAVCSGCALQRFLVADRAATSFLPSVPSAPGLSPPPQTSYEDAPKGEKVSACSWAAPRLGCCPGRAARPKCSVTSLSRLRLLSASLLLLPLFAARLRLLHWLRPRPLVGRERQGDG